MTNAQREQIETNHQPIYCRECKGRDTFDRFPEGDYKTESGKPFMLKWKCRVCGHTTLTSNKEYQIESYKRG